MPRRLQRSVGRVPEDRSARGREYDRGAAAGTKFRLAPFGEIPVALRLGEGGVLYRLADLVGVAHPSASAFVLTTMSSLPRSSITLTAICWPSRISKGTLRFPARRSQTPGS